MLKKIVLSGLFLMLLAGCDDASKAPQGDAGQGAKPAAEKPVDGTALYLPGGAGIDFKRKPISDTIIDSKKGKVRVVRYEFNESHEVVSKSVASILVAAGYSRKVNAPGNNQLKVTYRKKGFAPVLSRYNANNKTGPAKKTILALSWLQ